MISLRDDLTGVAAGGNKIRKLEWTVGAAIGDAADTLVTTGAPQSNHARLTAAAGARLGLDVVLVFPGAKAPDKVGNLLLDELLGATIVWTGDPPAGTTAGAYLAAAAQDAAADLRARGQRPAVIPFGGSNAVVAQGYRHASAEILEQSPALDQVVCAVGSGGTMAGLVAGPGTDRVLGVHTGAVDDPRAQVADLLRDMGEAVEPDALRIRTDHVGDGYESLTPRAAQALVTAARAEGLILDPVYTAHALAGLIDEIVDGSIEPGQTVVFLASGGLPGLFGHHALDDLLAQV